MTQSDQSPTTSNLPLRPQERALLAAAEDWSGTRVLCNTLGRGQLARRMAATRSSAVVTCHFVDSYLYQVCLRSPDPAPPNLHWECSPDPPASAYDLALLAFSMQGEAEFARDLMHAAYAMLEEGHRLATATDNPKDTWLHGEMNKLFAKVTRRSFPDAVVYSGVKTRPLAKRKSFRCQLTFRDGQRLLELVTRPGVFAHRRVDAGARQLLRIMAVPPASRVLEIGCGSGACSLAAAAREPTASVMAIDANTRAVACLAESARLNGLTNLAVNVDADGSTVPDGKFDLVLANPPYYGQHRIAEHFLRLAFRALCANGALHVVTKSPDWYAERLPEWLDESSISSLSGYFVVSGKKSPRIGAELDDS